MYMDDMKILGNNNDIIKAIKKMLINQFNMNDMSIENITLGFKISKMFGVLVLSQLH